MVKEPELMSYLQVKLLGGISAMRSDGSAVSFPMRRCQALFALLVLAGAKGLSREYCADLLWRRSGEVQARSSLRQVILALRRALSPDDRALVADRENIRLDLGHIETDLIILNSLEQASLAAPFTTGLLRLKDSLLGDFYLNEPSFESWLRQARNQHAYQLNRLLLGACRRWREAGSLDEALDVARIALEVDSFDEQALRELMHCHIARGSTGQALAAFSEFRQRLSS